MTRDPLALGFVGLAEAVPFIALALFGGHLADRRERLTLMRWSLGTIMSGSLGLAVLRSEEHTSELQSQFHLVCRLLLEKINSLQWRSVCLLTSRILAPA